MAKNSAIAKAALIVEAIANNRQPSNIADLANELGMPRQTVHRVLVQLSEIGLVRRDALRERYFVGQRLHDISMSVLFTSNADTAVNIILRTLAEEVRETCNIGMVEAGTVVYLDRVECDWPLRVQLRPGSRVPIYCTAIGKLLLAHMPEQKRQALVDSFNFERLTPNTLMNPGELWEDLQQIVKRGYAINNQEDSLGLVAVAVPIFNSEGEVAAGLAVHAVEARMPVEQIVRRLPLLRRTAAKLSRALFGSEYKIMRRDVIN